MLLVDLDMEFRRGWDSYGHFVALLGVGCMQMDASARECFFIPLFCRSFYLSFFTDSTHFLSSDTC
jgi:hypothetical protein